IIFLHFVIRRVDFNQVDPVAAVEGGHHHLLQESQIGLPLKIILLMKVDETGAVQTYSSEDLLRMALPSRWNPRLTSTFGPCRMQGRGLPKRSLVFEDHHRAFGFGVFFRFGYV